AAARLLHGENPVVADFRLGSGTMGLSLGLNRAQGMANVLSKPIDQITPRLIESELVAHNSGLRGLLSTVRIAESAIEWSRDAGLAVLKGLRSVSRISYVDLGAGLNPINYALQRECDQVVIVIDPVYITLMTAREIVQELGASLGEQQRLHAVVINRAAGSAPPVWRDVETALGVEIRSVISLASDLFTQALQANVPAVMFQPTAIASSQIAKLSDDLALRVPATGALG
ncbi:MAG: hypothetical protein SGJ24_01575, partial [Chloroflexota bacterium]|nr:hypothetical protein [Chloroflexota bacterium]